MRVGAVSAVQMGRAGDSVVPASTPGEGQKIQPMSLVMTKRGQFLHQNWCVIGKIEKSNVLVAVDDLQT